MKYKSERSWDKTIKECNERRKRRRNELNGWIRWEDEEITEEGHYWMGGLFPGDSQVSDPDIHYFNKTSMECYRGANIHNLHGYDADLVVWFGPILPPPLRSVK